MDEFSADLYMWNAELDKDSLVFRFKDPTILFKASKANLRKKFKIILNNFYPRYTNITKDYKNHIKNIVIEGHTSSEWRGVNNDSDKFRLNQKLSEKRANSVLVYTNTLENEIVINNIIWITTTFKSKGLSSSQLIFNEAGEEDKKLSRRVDFRIITRNNSDKPDVKLNSMEN
jgi:outer membrane protein OmpA-like peptidoglycan-associated protein